VSIYRNSLANSQEVYVTSLLVHPRHLHFEWVPEAVFAAPPLAYERIVLGAESVEVVIQGPDWQEAAVRVARFLPRTGLADYLFPWAMARAVRRYDPGAANGWPPLEEGDGRPEKRSVPNR
jgi:hypothetical protein